MADVKIRPIEILEELIDFGNERIQCMQHQLSDKLISIREKNRLTQELKHYKRVTSNLEKIRSQHIGG